jgi:glycine betaine/proline transport system substrate-binding protein
MLKEPAYNQRDWQALNEQVNPNVATAYPKVEVFIGVSKTFYDQAPQLITFLDNYQTTNTMVSEMLAYMEENNVDEEAVAVHFLKTQPQVWTQWVPRSVAKQVRAALQDH